MWRDGSASYAILFARAALVARLLRDTFHVAPGDRVAVAMPRDGDMIAVLLGVIASRAAYVPLDLAYPAERMAFIAANSGARLVVSRAAVSLALDMPRFDIDVLEPGPTPMGSLPAAAPEDLAYVIYTSGSTGTPKGVEVTHGSVMALVDWAAEAFSPAERGGMLASTSLCFDLSVFEIFVPLCTGGLVVIADNVLALPDLACRDAVRVINTVPSAMAELVASQTICLDGLTIALAGEAFPAHLARRLAAAGARRILNLYGPTEDTVYSTWAEVDPDAPGAPPIGDPLPGTRAYVVDAAGNLCADSEPGELHLAGRGLARGYHGDPAKTAERFVPDRFGGEAGAKMYRTGDRVCRRDGRLHYFGRLDEQVKVHGRRIELGEIEHALGLLPGVKDCAVTLAEGPGGLPALVGYVAGSAAPAALREGLAAKLPGWMVPALFVGVPAIPRSLNGKRERGRLPRAVWPGATAPLPAGSPAGAAAIARLFEELLGRPARLDASFAEQGGDSLLAVRLRARLRRDFGLDPTLAALFDNATPVRLAQLAAESAPQTNADVAGRVPADDDLVPLSPMQRQIWFAAQLEPEDDAFIVKARIEIEGSLDPALVERSLASIIARQPALRTGFGSQNGVPSGRVMRAPAPPLPLVDLSGLADGDIVAADRLAALAAPPFALDRPPLLRAELVRLGEQRWELLVAIHHIVFDDWSLAVLVRELAETYAALETGAAARDPLPREAPRCEARVEPTTGEPGVPPTSGTTASAVGTIAPQTLAAVKRLAREREATPFMVLLAAFQALIAAESGCERVTILTAADRREASGNEERIGCFVAMVPISLDVGRDQTFGVLVDATKAAALRALDGTASTPSRRTGRWSRIAFGLQNAPPAHVAIGGRRFTANEVRPTRAHLPLTIWADERSGTLRMLWTRREDAFSRDEAERLRRRYERILERAIRNPEETMDRLTDRAPEPPQRARPSLGGISLRPINRACLADWGAMTGMRLPAIVQARTAGLDPAHWARGEREAIRARLRTTGAVLLRGFKVDSIADFRGFGEAVSGSLVRYSERSSPRTQVEDAVYTSTDHPPDQPIVLHTEQSYTLDWPMRIMFWCQEAPTDRGRTPIADTRGVLARLSPVTVAAFETRGIRYVRNYIPGVSLTWQEAFQTDERSAVEAFCRGADIDVEWIGAAQLRTSQRRPAIRRHPDTDERVWFNHGYFFNLASLAVELREALRSSLAEADLPYQTYFGDGGAIPPDMLEEIRAAYDAETVSFDWRQGDILLLDNMLIAHGREPFSGPRAVRTIMADPVSSYGAPGPTAAVSTRSA